MKTNSEPVIIFGEALVDVFGEEVIPGGAPFNVARHLAAFGLNPTMVTRIGDDAYGALLLDQFQRFGLSTDGVQIDRYAATGQVFVRLSGQSHVFDIPSGQTFDQIDARDAIDCVSRIGQPAYVYSGTLIQRAEQSRTALTSVLIAAKAPVYLDLNLRSSTWTLPVFEQMIGRPQILKVNDTELQLLLSWYQGGRTVELRTNEFDRHGPAIASMMQKYGIRLLVVTLGPEGVVVFDAEGICIAREAGIASGVVMDTVGAGDAFSSVVLAGEMLHWPLAITLCRANAFAAAICGIRGAVPANMDFYLPWIEQWMGEYA